MAKKISIVVVLLLVVASAAYVLTSIKRAPAKGAQIPPGFAAIKTGMSQSEVVSLVGAPVSKSHYAKYEKRPAEYWANLQKQVDAGSGAPVYGSTPSLAFIRARVELTHRYKDVWMYKPKPNLLMTLYFGDDGTLLNEGMAALGSGRGSDGPGSPMTSQATGGA